MSVRWCILNNFFSIVILPNMSISFPSTIYLLLREMKTWKEFSILSKSNPILSHSVVQYRISFKMSFKTCSKVWLQAIIKLKNLLQNELALYNFSKTKWFFLVVCYLSFRQSRFFWGLDVKDFVDIVNLLTHCCLSVCQSF